MLKLIFIKNLRRLRRVFALLILLPAQAALGQADSAPPPPRVDGSTEAVEVERTREFAQVAPEAVARVRGTVSPGLKVELVGSDSTGGALRYRWIQTLGPQVEIEQSDTETASFIVPDGASTLGFLLIVGNTAGLDLTPVLVPVEGRRHGEAEAGLLMADAGDDQVAYVGRQVTLNGIRSQPRGSIGYRWIQTAGPAIPLKIEDSYTYTFVPNEPGVYRFALVVAQAGSISQPDFVEVVVPATAAPSFGLGMAPTRTAEELAHAALVEVPGGLAVAAILADSFDAAAQRLDLYESYGAFFNELSRRVEAALPQDPTQRAIWVQRLCSPITLRLMEELRAAGLDATSPQAHDLPLSEIQKDRLAIQLEGMAAGFRKLTRTR